MFLTMLKSKIHRATVTDAKLYYQGSITIDESLIKKADLLEGEKVEVLNLNNGSRIETYVIKGKAGSGAICLNGPAAHSGKVGDEIIIVSYAIVESKKAKSIKPKIVYVDKSNRIKN